VLAPFETSDAQEALLRAGTGLNPKGFTDIAERLPSLRVPVRIVYGANDRILPDVAATMARVAEDLPQSEVSELPDCGHFLQEERPEEVGRLLRDFFAPARSVRSSGRSAAAEQGLASDGRVDG
jgi:haloalkane dehalogenase